MLVYLRLTHIVMHKVSQVIVETVTLILKLGNNRVGVELVSSHPYIAVSLLGTAAIAPMDVSST